MIYDDIWEVIFCHFLEVHDFSRWVGLNHQPDNRNKMGRDFSTRRQVFLGPLCTAVSAGGTDSIWAGAEMCSDDEKTASLPERSEEM